MKANTTNKSIFAVLSLMLIWSLTAADGARADQNQFTDNNDGTVYDAKTGLTWQQEGLNGPFTWSEALDYVATLNTGAGPGECSGWVLPTSKELKRIVDHHKNFAGPALINSAFFPNTAADFYWSSSSHKNTLKYAISFGNGQQRKMSSANEYYVRAVRNECDPADMDGDGFLPSEGDCNDSDPNINPMAIEVCDGYVDNNCDDEFDLTCWDVDNDGDGQTENQGDCDDRDPFNFAGNTEVCDGADNDCDGVADNGLTFDLDEDGYTEAGSCSGSKDDCDDSNAGVHPGAAEICDDLVDQNCDGGDLSCQDVDNDGDGQAESEGDCDDTDPANYSGNTEVCDGADNDCDGVADNGLTFDADGDGFSAIGSCAGSGDDCDDNNDQVNPGTAEVCDGLDNDCDVTVDENLTQPTSCGVGECAATGIETCDNGNWINNTCVAGNPAAEVCDDLDNNCDGQVDEDLTRATNCGVGACSAVGIETCFAGLWGGDTCTPGAPAAEVCGDGIDQNCDGGDEQCTVPPLVLVEDDQVLSEFHDTVQNAYNIIPGSIGNIFTLAIDYPESLSLNKDVSLIMTGGYDDLLSGSPVGWTTIVSGAGMPALTIRNGKVIIANIILR